MPISTTEHPFDALRSGGVNNEVRRILARTVSMAMNDNEPDGIYEPPEWVWDIFAKHDLESDSLIMAAAELLSMAAADLTKVSQTAFREGLFSVADKRLVAACKIMIVDAERLYLFCPTGPVPGSITVDDDGSQTWTPDPG